MRRPRKVVERNIESTSAVMDELLASPALLEKLPARFRLIVLPEAEPDLWLCNLDLLQTESERPVVFARVTPAGKGVRAHTDFYAPPAA